MSFNSKLIEEVKTAYESILKSQVLLPSLLLFIFHCLKEYVRASLQLLSFCSKVFRGIEQMLPLTVDEGAASEPVDMNKLKAKFQQFTQDHQTISITGGGNIFWARWDQPAIAGVPVNATGATSSALPPSACNITIVHS